MQQNKSTQRWNNFAVSIVYVGISITQFCVIWKLSFLFLKSLAWKKILLMVSSFLFIIVQCQVNCRWQMDKISIKRPIFAWKHQVMLIVAPSLLSSHVKSILSLGMYKVFSIPFSLKEKKKKKKNLPLISHCYLHQNYNQIALSQLNYRLRK